MSLSARRPSASTFLTEPVPISSARPYAAIHHQAPHQPFHSVYQHYLTHFSSLPATQQFHFATRLKNWHSLGFLPWLSQGDLDFFHDYLSKHRPDTNLAKLLQNNDYSRLSYLELRQPYFAKHPHLYAIEAALCRLHHLYQEYQLDLRAEFLDIIPEPKLRLLAGGILSSPADLAYLSSYAANILSLLDRYFFSIPRDSLISIVDRYRRTRPEYPASLFIYFITHLIICDSAFYSRPLSKAKRASYHSALKTCRELIVSSECFRHELHKSRRRPYTSHKPHSLTSASLVSLDAELEFLVACELTGYRSGLKSLIRSHADFKSAAEPFVIDRYKPPRLNTLTGSEHRNVLFIMSGLDD